MVNIAVVGYGYRGPNLVRNFQDLDTARVTMCCDLSADRLAQVKRKHPAITVTSTLDDVLTAPDVDAVAIATPVGTHYDFARRRAKGSRRYRSPVRVAAHAEEASAGSGDAHLARAVRGLASGAHHEGG